ncbi:PQQ-binding-like beta-propeller repeat protein [Candidatus Bathycorpusculum sp.]|uniref:outer membrane protein assembly factor BamB family protein n=1 Tax=Candidatus Bathycorpusculum sp. TaxID=2994959 RepID=UPI0031CC8040
MENFATSYTIADGKIFTIDVWGNLVCFDVKTGTRLWKNMIGVYGSVGPIIVKNGIVYVGSPDYGIGGVVKTVDVKTGKLLPLQFHARDTSSAHKRGPDTFNVINDRIFVQQSSWRVYSAISGKLLWETLAPSVDLPGLPYLESVWAFEDNLVLASGFFYTKDNTYNEKSTYRLNPDIGTVMWSILGFSDKQPLVYNDMIIFWDYKANYADIGQTMIAVEASSGAKLWSINLNEDIYQPTIYNDQLLFVTSNGYIYALNLPDGHLAWNTPVALPPESDISPIEVDTQMQMIFWGYTTGWYNESIDNFQYMGNIYSLDVNNGALVWTAPFANNSPHGSLSKIALLNNTVYLSTSKALWALNKTTGMELGVEPFDHYVQPITSADNKLFVVADLYVIAYTDFGSTNTYPPQLTNILPYTIPICIIFLVIIILMLRLYYRKKHANTCGQSLP